MILKLTVRFMDLRSVLYSSTVKSIPLLHETKLLDNKHFLGGWIRRRRKSPLELLRNNEYRTWGKQIKIGSSCDGYQQSWSTKEGRWRKRSLSPASISDTGDQSISNEIYKDGRYSRSRGGWKFGYQWSPRLAGLFNCAVVH